MYDHVVSLRPIDPTVDLEDLYQLAYACDAAVSDNPDTTRAELHTMLTSPDADLADGSRKAVLAGRTVGFLCVEIDEHSRQVFLDVYGPVHDETVWDALLAHGSAFAASYVAGLDPVERGRWSIGAGSYAQDARYAAALERWGLRRVRCFHRMEILFEDRPPLPPALPKGVSLTQAGDDEGARRIAHAVMEASFAEHWRHAPRRYEDFVDAWREDSFAPEQWWIAAVDGVPAGVSLGNDHLAEMGLSYVSRLGVLAEYRGRGLGRLLLQQAFAQASALGRRGVRLGVDSENDSGALRLYTSVGMRQVEALDAWSRELA